MFEASSRTLSLILSLLTCVACSAGRDTEGPIQGGGAPTPSSGPASTGGEPNEPLIPIGEGPTSPSDAPDTEGDCDNVLDVTYRDFSEAHVDFEGAFAGDEVRLQLVAPELDSDGKPVFLSSTGCPWSTEDPTQCNPDWNPEQRAIASRESFDQWYRTVDGVNIEFQKELSLQQTVPGSGVYVFESDQFFPLAPEEGFGPTPQNGQGRNFLFTTEIHLLFTYIAGQTFSFRGDDDLWIFINNKLALDLGSMHNPAEGVIDFDAQAEALGIVANGVYRMDVFHAERHTQVSSFRIETNIGCFSPAPPRVR